MYISKSFIYGAAIVLLSSLGLITWLFSQLIVFKGQTSSLNQLNENVNTLSQNGEQLLTKHREKSVSESQNQETPTYTVVSIIDIKRGHVRIMGKTGLLLENLVTIRGEWKPSKWQGKTSEIRFEVTHVNGNMLSEKVEFYRPFVKPQKHSQEESIKWEPEVGEIWELRGIETTPGFRGVPAVLHDELFGWPVSSSVLDGFNTEFHYLTRRRVQ